MQARVFVRIVEGRLFICEEVVGEERCGLTGKVETVVNGYTEIEVTPDIHAALLVHYAALGSKPKAAPKKAKAGGSLAGFDECWSIYLRRDAKAAARKAWVAQNCDQHVEAIKADIARRSTDEAWTKDGGKYVPYMATYLNQRRWEDEPGDAQTEEGWL